MIKNANALVTYMEQNILPDYDNFVCAGAQYNDDAVYINEVVEKFHQMAADLKQRTESVMEYISQIQRAVEEGSEGINLAAKIQPRFPKKFHTFQAKSCIIKNS